MSNFWSDLGDWIGFGAARRQHERNLEMSNTAIQRQTEDAKKAGLNTAMLYSGSSSAGASTVPSSANTTGASGVASLVNSAANLARSFNNDKSNSNNVTSKDLVNTVMAISKMIK